MSDDARTVRAMWHPVGTAGLEHLADRRGPRGGRIADGVVIGERDGNTFRLRYRIVCDAPGRMRGARLELLDETGGTLELETDGDGAWLANGRARPDLAGCREVDVSATPFTNTLAIERLALAPGASAELDVVHVAVPALTAERARQRYTGIDARHVRYEGLFRRFEAVLPLDEDGLVIDYPDTFVRLDPDAAR